MNNKGEKVLVSKNSKTAATAGPVSSPGSKGPVDHPVELKKGNGGPSGVKKGPEDTTRIKKDPVGSQQRQGLQGAPSTEENADKTKKKKKRISKAEKEERKAKREADTLVQLYKPKDSHVHLINPDLFRKLKGDDRSTPKGRQQRLSSINVPSPSVSSAEAPPETPSQSDFPCLNETSSPSPWGNRSFSSVISSPAPVKKEPLQSQTPVTSGNVPKINTPSNSSQANANPIQETPGTSGQLLIPSAIPSSSSSITKTPKNMSKSPLVVSLDALIVKRDKKAGKLPRKNERTSALLRENVKFTMGNVLDSSSPGVIHRGKIRVKPKKPSKLKRCILQNRELRKNQNLSPFAHKKSGTSNSLSLVEESIKEEDEAELAEDEKGDAAISNDTKEEELQDETETGDKDTAEVVRPEGAVFRELLEKAEKEVTTKEPVIPESFVELVKMQMHNRKFRTYCDMFVTKEFHMQAVVPFLKELYRLQNRLYHTDPIKFKTRRRYVNGLKDTLSSMKLNKVQMVILAPDIEPNNQQGGLDERVSEIITLSKEKNIPYIFSGNRFVLGKAIMQTKSPVSAIAILNYQSVEELFGKVIEAAEKLREHYQNTFKTKLDEMLASGNNAVAVSLKVEE